MFLLLFYFGMTVNSTLKFSTTTKGLCFPFMVEKNSIYMVSRTGRGHDEQRCANNNTNVAVFNRHVFETTRLSSMLSLVTQGVLWLMNAEWSIMVKWGGSSVCLCIVTNLRAGRSGVRIRQVQGIFLFTKQSIPALGLTQSPIAAVTCALSTVVKQQVNAVRLSPP